MQSFFFFKKRLFEYENHFAVENKTQKNVRGNFKNTLENFVVAIKKMLVIQFPYMEIV